MRLGLIGLPMSGKTTVFSALTSVSRPPGSAASGRPDVQIAVVNVPDPRLDRLYELFPRPRKVQAQITYADVGGLAKGIGAGGLSGSFRNELNQMDGFLHVVRVFEDPNVPHPEGDVDPQRDLEILENEFLLADMVTVEKRRERLRDEIAKGKDRAANLREDELFARLQSALEDEIPLRELDLSEAERQSLRGYGFLTLKPKLVVLNMGEEGNHLGAAIRVRGELTPVLAIRGKLEAEISQLDEEEAAIFLEEYGIEEPMRDRVIRESYELLRVQTFFTIGDDEVRAWPVRKGATAQEAAGVVHTDMQRGFIRAEIIPWDVLVELGGLAEARHAGKLRLEGKDYIMQDGDVMTVRFNV